MLPAAWTATPSAALVDGGFLGRIGNDILSSLPSRMLPMRIPRFHSGRVGATEPDSESAAYIMSFLSIQRPLMRLYCSQP
jgi:hypothetical protein